MNCWNTLKQCSHNVARKGGRDGLKIALIIVWAISSQATAQAAEGSTTRSRSLTETVKAHERATPTGDDIVCSAGKLVVGGIKCRVRQHKGINNFFQSYVREYINASRFAWEMSLVGKASATWAQPIAVTDAGTVGDGGTSVDTEFNLTEGTDLSTVTTLDLGEATITSIELGIRRDLADTAKEDSIMDGLALVNFIAMDAASILSTAVEHDTMTLFGSFSNSTGSTGSALTIANVTAAISALRNRGNRAPGGVVAVISDTQMTDFQTALEAIGTSWTAYPGGADRLMNIQPGPDNGIQEGHVLSFKGVDFYQSGLAVSANTAADDVGAVFVRGDVEANHPHCALGMAISRPFTVELQRNASLRGEEIVCTRRCAPGILLNSAGQKLVTDAT